MGRIETLPRGSLRVKVYAGIDPVTKKKHVPTELIPSGPGAAREAEKARTRLLAQVDEKRNPRTRATMNQLLDRYLKVLDVEESTKRSYAGYVNNHIRPMLGTTPVADATPARVLMVMDALEPLRAGSRVDGGAGCPRQLTGPTLACV